jgi:hypothetical protein
MEIENPFQEFLKRKNIDAAAFMKNEVQLFQDWQELFSELHEESFVMMQKFRINPLRRRFPLVLHPARQKDGNPGKE